MKINGNIIEADEGFVLSGNNIYGIKIRLGDWDKAENYKEITQEEYEEILKQQELEMQII